MRRVLTISLLLSVVALLLLSVRRQVPVTDWLAAIVFWVRNAGAPGIAVFAIAYVASTVALLPAFVLTLAAGSIYGPVTGTAIVSPVSVVAATAAFLLGRTIARGWIARRVASQPVFAAVDHAVASQGFKVVALLRLSPLVPFNVLNYALGLTNVRLRDYVLASWLGMLPATALYVYLGSLVTNIGALGNARAGGSPSTPARLLYWGGLVATVAVVVLVTRAARQTLDRTLTRPHRPPSL